MMEDVDDNTPMRHVSKSPNRIDDHAKSTTEDPTLLPNPKVRGSPTTRATKYCYR